MVRGGWCLWLVVCLRGFAALIGDLFGCLWYLRCGF